MTKKRINEFWRPPAFKTGSLRETGGADPDTLDDIEQVKATASKILLDSARVASLPGDVVTALEKLQQALADFDVIGANTRRKELQSKISESTSPPPPIGLHESFSSPASAGLSESKLAAFSASLR